MNKAEKDKLADAMVAVCVRDFGASEIDSEGGLLWLYFRERLGDVGSSYVKRYSEAHNQIRRDVEDEAYKHIGEFMDDVVARKKDVKSRANTVRGGS